MDVIRNRKPTASRFVILAFLSVTLCVTTPVFSKVVEVKFSPAPPVAESTFVVTVNGVFSDGCWDGNVAWSSISVVGNVLTMAIIAKDHNYGGPCATVLIPYRVTQEGPHLPAGNYTLAVIEYHNSIREPDPEFFLQKFSVGPAVPKDTVHVPEDAPTIQAGIDMVKPGGQVWVARGTYAGEGNRDLDFHGKSLTLEGEGNGTFVFVELGGTPQTPHRALRFHSGEDSTSVVRWMVFNHGYANGDGGAILCEDASPKIEWCALQFCQATGSGGAIYVAPGRSPVLSRLELYQNSAGQMGGAVAVAGAHTEIWQCEFASNTSGAAGGGLGLLAGGHARLLQCSFYSNRAGTGGALAVEQSGVDVIGAVMVRNTAVQGSGLSIRDATTSTIRSVTFFGNSCDTGATVYVVRSPSAGPVAPQFIQNLITYNGTDHAFTVEGAAAPVLSCTDIYGNVSGNWTDSIAKQLGVNGNIEADPLYCDTARLAFTISTKSPCAAAQSPCGQLIGAVSPACDDSPTGIDDSTLFPNSFRLDQNYPNPFNPSTVIEYTLPRACDVKITIYNVLGTQVRLMVNESQPAGGYKIVWDGTDDSGARLASGVYFYRLEAGDLVATKKMILLK